MSLRFTLLAGALWLPASSLDATDGDKYLPADTAVVLRVDVKSALAAPALKDDKDGRQKAQAFLEQLLADYEPLHKHLASAGLDVFRDIGTITTAMPRDADFSKAFAVLEGTFDPARFKKAAEDAAAKPESGLKLIKIGAHDVIEIALPSRAEPVYAFLVDKSTLLGAASKEKMTAALKLVGTDKAEPPKEVQVLVQLLDPKQHFGFAGTRPAVAKLMQRSKEPLAETLELLLEGADTVQGGLTLGNECDIVFRFTTKDQKTAKQFRQNTNLALAALRGVMPMKVKADPAYAPLAEWLRGLQTSLDGTTVVWRSKVSLKTAEKMMKNLTK
jgi:hypothetical protein